MPTIAIVERKDFTKLAVFKFTAGTDEVRECKAWISDADHWGLRVGVAGKATFEEEEYQGKKGLRITEWNGEGPQKRGGGGRSAGSPAREAAISKASDNKNASILACCAMNNATAMLVARATQDPDLAKTLSPTMLKAWTLDAMAVLNQITPQPQVDPFKED